MIDRGDEGQHAADGRQVEVAARLIRLGLNAELDVVIVGQDIFAQEVDRLAEPAGRLDRVLAGIDLDPLAPAPEDKYLRFQLGRDVQRVHDLLGSEGPDGGIGAGEGAVLEDGMIEQVGRGHGGLDAPVADRFLDVLQDLVALPGIGAEGDDVVVMKLEAVAVALGQPADALQGRQLGARLIAERIAAAVLQAPEAEGELVLLGGREKMGRHDAPFYGFETLLGCSVG